MPKIVRVLTALALCFAVGAAAPARAQADAAVVARVIVKFRDHGPRAAFALADRVALVAADEGVALSHRRAMALGAHVLSLDRALPRRDAEALVARLARNKDVEYAQVDRRRRPLFVPNDTFFAQQTYLQNTPGGISAIAAWDTTTGSPGTIVAVVDSGYRPHADLAGRILSGYDFISDPKVANDGDGRDADASDPGDWISAADLNDPDFKDCGPASASSWHGTSVTGIVAANANNGQYVAGIDWAAKILPVRVLGKCGGFDSDILDGIAWAAGLPVPGVPANPYPAQVINLSFGGTDPCPAGYSSVFDQALAHGVTRAIVVAAGNDSTDVATEAPANCPQVIAVAATTHGGSLTAYSNYGAGIAVSAPGGSGADLIYVLSNSGATAPAMDSYDAEAGTSFATPIVAGVASLVLGVAPNLSAAQLRAVLMSTAKPFPMGTCNTSLCGAGIVAADAAVQAALTLAGGGNVNVQGLWWARGGSESGWGVNFAHQGNQVFATWYTYDTTGKPWWLSMLATRSSGNTYSGPIYVDAGPPFNAYVGAGVPTQAGSGTVAFSDANSGSFTYTVNGTTQTKAIARYDLATGPQPICTYSATTPNFGAATNYQDLWWVANGAESGWGINFAHQGASVFATWYTYDVDRTPLWLSVLATRIGATNVYTGPLYRTSGPRFDAYNPAQVLPVQVGSATLTFADGNSAAFAYTMTGVGGLPATSQAKTITRFPFAAAGGTVCQ